MFIVKLSTHDQWLSGIMHSWYASYFHCIAARQDRKRGKYSACYGGIMALFLKALIWCRSEGDGLRWGTVITGGCISLCLSVCREQSCCYRYTYIYCPDPRMQPARYTLVDTQGGDEPSKSSIWSGFTQGFGQRLPQSGQRLCVMCRTGKETLDREIVKTCLFEAGWCWKCSSNYLLYLYDLRSFNSLLITTDWKSMTLL